VYVFHEETLRGGWVDESSALSLQCCDWTTFKVVQTQYLIEWADISVTLPPLTVSLVFHLFVLTQSSSAHALCISQVLVSFSAVLSVYKFWFRFLQYCWYKWFNLFCLRVRYIYKILIILTFWQLDPSILYRSIWGRYHSRISKSKLSTRVLVVDLLEFTLLLCSAKYLDL